MSSPSRLPEETTLRHRLAALRQRLRFVVLMRGISVTLTLVVLGAALAGFLDSWQPLPGLPRALFLVLILGGTAILAYRYLIQPLSQRVDDLSLALRIESHFPRLNDALASTVEFLSQQSAPEGESPAVRREAIRRALASAQNYDFNRVIDTRGMRSAFGAALFSVALAVTLVVLFPSTAVTALIRLAVPFGGADWPRLTLLEIEPPRTRIGRNEAFELRGKVKGVIPETATIIFRHENFPERREIIRLTKTGDQAKLFRRWNTEVVSTNFKVKVLAGDAESPEYDVRVVPPPALALLDGKPSPLVRLDVPAYTFMDRVQPLTPGDGTIWAVPGTVATVRAAADRPLAQAWIEYVPDLRYAQHSAILSPLGATQPLAAATLTAMGQTVWDRVYATFDQDRTRFTFRFTPRVAGQYLILLKDESGLVSDPRSFELNLRQDPSPVVRLERPAPGRDVLSVLPTATMTLHSVAEDPPISDKLPVGALRNVFVSYRTAPDEAPRRWPYWEAKNQEHPTLHEVNVPLPIAQFKHRDGKPLRPGDVLIIQACAEDYDDVSIDKAPGASPEVYLQIVDRSGLDREIGRKMAELQKDITDQRDKAQAALQRTARAENRVKKNENLNGPELEQLTQSEQAQREERDRFGDKQDQIRGKIDRVQNALKQNGMTNSPLREQLGGVDRDLKRLADHDLVQAEQKLTEARKAAEPSAQAADKAIAARRQQEELKNQANAKRDEANKKETEARTAPDAAAKDKLQNEAKQARELEKDLRKQAELVGEQARAAEQEAAKLLPRQKVADSLDAARRRQEEVEKTLNNVLSRLEPAGALREIKGEAADLQRDQSQLEQRVADLEPKTRGKEKAELSLEQRDELELQRETQQDLEQRTNKLIQRLRQEAERRDKTEPQQAKNLKDAADQAEKDNIAGQMRDAGDKIDKNKTVEARKDQRDAANKLDKLARSLGKQNEAEQEELLKKLRKNEKEVVKLKEEQEQLRKKMQELQSKKGQMDPKKFAEELKRLNARQQQLQQQAQQLAKRLTRENAADRARQALEKGAKNPEELLDRLNEARLEVERARQREQESLEREQLTRIQEVIERLRDRQLSLNEEAARMQKDVKANARWTRGLQASLLGLRDGQSGLRAEVEDIIPKELADTPVFARMMQRSAEAMTQAAQRAEDIVGETKKRNANANADNLPDAELAKLQKAAVDKLPDADLTSHQKQALVKMEQVIAAVKSQISAPPAPPKRKNNGGGGGMSGGAEQPEEGSPPPQNGLPPLAQLELVKSIQLETRKRKDDFQKQHPNLEKLSDADQAEYNSIIKDEEDVADLIEEIRRPLTEKIKKEAKAEEGMKK